MISCWFADGNGYLKQWDQILCDGCYSNTTLFFYWNWIIGGKFVSDINSACYHEVTDCCRTHLLCTFDPEFVCGCAMNFLPSDWSSSLLVCSTLFYMILAIIQIEFLLVVSICRLFLLVTWNAWCILWNCQGKYQTGKHFSLPKVI